MLINKLKKYTFIKNTVLASFSFPRYLFLQNFLITKYYPFNFIYSFIRQYFEIIQNVNKVIYKKKKPIFSLKFLKIILGSSHPIILNIKRVNIYFQ